MKKILNKIKITCLAAGLMLSGACTPYLDVVPDANRTVDDIFRTQKDAYMALANAYGYLPQIEDPNQTPWFLGDEYLSRISYLNEASKIPAIKIMNARQSVSAPYLDNWSGGQSLGGDERKGKPLYQAINQCNIFLTKIDDCEDMDVTTKAQWKADVKFLKAYYHFLLVQKYGPIVISDNPISFQETNPAILYPGRSKVEDCFDFIIALMKAAIPDIRDVAQKSDYGMLTQSAAKAIFARVMVTRARPFFNGNKAMYGDFLDRDGQPFFSQTADPQKWVDALAAVNDAIETAVNHGYGMYYKPSTMNYYYYDTADVKIAPQRMETLYSLRMMPVDKWNQEIVWGFSNLAQFQNTPDYESWGDIQSAALPARPNGYDGQGDFEGPNSNFRAGAFIAASYRMEERYYTKNGLPIENDLTFNSANKYELVTTPARTDPTYADIAGLLIPETQTIQLHLNRELRYYANMAVPGTWFRAQRYRFRAEMMYGKELGKADQGDQNYYSTGIAVKKWCHPETSAGYPFRVTFFPYPIIRMADLYLLKAEASNEANGPGQEAWDALNMVRRRAGIPDVEVVWADPTICNAVDSHKDQGRLRNIILQERGIELAFEGSRFWDMRDYMRSTTEFTRAIQGWNVNSNIPRAFYTLVPVELRRFSATDALWPISIDEMNTNNNLIQNPGWQ